MSTETMTDVERFAALFRDTEAEVFDAEQYLKDAREHSDNVLREAQRSGVNMSALAEELGVHRTRLYQRINRGD